MPACGACESTTCPQTQTFTSANVFMPIGVDNSWDLEEFKEDFKIKVQAAGVCPPMD